MKLEGVSCSTEQMLLAMIYDRVNWIRWAMSTASNDPESCPEPLAPKLLGKDPAAEKNSEIVAFDDGFEFERSREMILEGK